MKTFEGYFLLVLEQGLTICVSTHLIEKKRPDPLVGYKRTRLSYLSWVRYLLFALVISAVGLPATAPSFYAELATGGRTSLKESLKPGRYLLISFWATWCAPCMAEMRELAKFKVEPASSKMDWITVNVDTSETSSDVMPSYRLQGITAPLINDPKHEVFVKFSPSKTLPYSVLIDSNGTIVESFSGYTESMVSTIKKRVQ